MNAFLPILGKYGILELDYSWPRYLQARLKSKTFTFAPIDIGLRLLVMALYNVSINQAGLSLLHEDNGGAVFGVVANCLQAQSTNELRLMALRLLLSLTCDLNEVNVLNTVFKNIPKELIKTMVQQGDANVQAIAQEVLENLNRAEERIERGTKRKEVNHSSSPASSGPGCGPGCGPGYGQYEGTPVTSVNPQHRTAWKLSKT